MGKQYTQGSGSNPVLLSGVETDDSVTTDPLAGTVNDLNVPGSALVSTILLTASATFTITGLAGGSPGRQITLVNQSSFTGAFSGNDAGSMAANRFSQGAALGSGNSIKVVWNALLGLWVLQSPQGTLSSYTLNLSKAVVTPVNGDTVNMTTSRTLINPAGTIATLTLNFPTSPADGTEVAFSSTQIVTTLTLAAPGALISNPTPATIGSGTSFRYIYNAATNTWYRW